MRRISRRRFVAAATAGLAALSRPAAALGAPSPRASLPLILNDASRLNPVRVSAHVVVRANEEQQRIAVLRSLLRQAALEGRAVCIGGERHSMGGQSLPRDGAAASLAASSCTLEAASRVYRVRSETRWRDVIAALDPAGFSVAVMQSNNDFSVGGTLSVNAHGWPVRFGPFGTTVRMFRLMLADGTIVTCSRAENPELFGLVIGGYGLFGIVLDAELDMVENALLAATFEILDAPRLGQRFIAAVEDLSTRMVYARLAVARAGFLREALLISYRPLAAQPQLLPPARTSAAFGLVSREIFRRQIGSEAGKRARWYAETMLAPRIAAQPVTRNALLSYPVAALADRDRGRTDILHEYFLPADRLEDFLAACRELIPAHRQDLLNVTLRYVAADPVSVLAFAPAARIAAVMLFSQPATAAADDAMRAMTERLIEQALALGGSFYLPYRLHARPEQIKSAYPRLDEFLAQKRHYDPQLRFRNLMWDKYFA
jgi:FAD/FMN-containing dehydrogenase